MPGDCRSSPGYAQIGGRQHYGAARAMVGAKGQDGTTVLMLCVIRRPSRQGQKVGRASRPRPAPHLPEPTVLVAPRSLTSQVVGEISADSLVRESAPETPPETTPGRDFVVPGRGSLPIPFRDHERLIPRERCRRLLSTSAHRRQFSTADSRWCCASRDESLRIQATLAGPRLCRTCAFPAVLSATWCCSSSTTERLEGADVAAVIRLVAGVIGAQANAPG